jgi:hypothetical protein
MQFSYVVAATRPVGPFLLYSTLSLLFEPAFELISGIPLKENLVALKLVSKSLAFNVKDMIYSVKIVTSN